LPTATLLQPKPSLASVAARAAMAAGRERDGQ
jgi:hypothetical protein